jgi:FixJ family two-component response regulator
MRTALGRLLRAAGFEASLHASAEEFLDARLGAAPVCLVVDVQLGGMSGLDLQRRILRRQSRVPVIFITAHDEPATRERAASLGCLAYLCKPFEGQRLVELIPRRPATPLSSASS